MKRLKTFITSFAAVLCVVLVAAQSTGPAYASTSSVAVNGNSAVMGYFSIDLYSDEGLTEAITSNGFSNGSVGYTVESSGGQTQYVVESGSTVLSMPGLYMGCRGNLSPDSAEISVIEDSGFFDHFVLTIGDKTYELYGENGTFTEVLDCPADGAVVLTGFYSGGAYSEIPSVSLDVVFSLTIIGSDAGASDTARVPSNPKGPKAVCADKGCTVTFFELSGIILDQSHTSSDIYVANPVTVGTHEAFAIVNSNGSSFISGGGRTDAQVTFRAMEKFCIHVLIDSSNNSGWSVDITVNIGGRECTLPLSGAKGQYDYYIGAAHSGDGCYLVKYGSLSEVEPYWIETDELASVEASTRGNTSVSLIVVLF